jgi:hypothetical protein
MAILPDFAALNPGYGRPEILAGWRRILPGCHPVYWP